VSYNLIPQGVDRLGMVCRPLERKGKREHIIPLWLLEVGLVIALRLMKAGVQRRKAIP